MNSPTESLQLSKSLLDPDSKQLQPKLRQWTFPEEFVIIPMSLIFLRQPNAGQNEKLWRRIILIVRGSDLNVEARSTESHHTLAKNKSAFAVKRSQCLSIHICIKDDLETLCPLEISAMVILEPYPHLQYVILLFLQHLFGSAY